MTSKVILVVVALTIGILSWYWMYEGGGCDFYTENKWLKYSKEAYQCRMWSDKY